MLFSEKLEGPKHFNVFWTFHTSNSHALKTERIILFATFNPKCRTFGKVGRFQRHFWKWSGRPRTIEMGRDDRSISILTHIKKLRRYFLISGRKYFLCPTWLREGRTRRRPVRRANRSRAQVSQVASGGRIWTCPFFASPLLSKLCSFCYYHCINKYC